MPDAFENMDRMYRLQRYFYDATRKYYLLGRDRLLNDMQARPDEHILEVGCGTARNLIILARRHPDAHFFGLDASAAMLKTAQAKIDTAGVKNVTLKTALADEFSFANTFGLGEPFDKIFFSYSISMMPRWQDSIDNALDNLKPGGLQFIIDFYDQKGLPAPLRRFLNWWLKQFHVRYWERLVPHIDSLSRAGRVEYSFIPLYRRYSFVVSMKKLPSQD